MRKASSMVVPLLTTCSRRSLGITTRVSTRCFRSAMPISAFFMRCLPSKAKGLVTTEMVSAPRSRAISATMGAAPVPVPPPMPAVTNTRSAPLSAWAISSRLSSAALRPTSGTAPAPRPLVSFSPIWILVCAPERASAWRSVLMAMNSTPRSPASTMRFTALVPPPPQPTTLIEAKLPWSASWNSITLHPPDIDGRRIVI